MSVCAGPAVDERLRRRRAQEGDGQGHVDLSAGPRGPRPSPGADTDAPSAHLTPPNCHSSHSFLRLRADGFRVLEQMVLSPNPRHLIKSQTSSGSVPIGSSLSTCRCRGDAARHTTAGS